MSDPRVLLAAERTLLAWSRTALGLIGFGFVLERAGLLVHAIGGQPMPGESLQAALGLVFVLLGVAAAIGASWRHRNYVAGLIARDGPSDYRALYSVSLTLALGLLGLALLLMLLWGRL